MLKGMNFSEIQTDVPEYFGVKPLLKLISYEDNNCTYGSVSCSSSSVSTLSHFVDCASCNDSW